MANDTVTQNSAFAGALEASMSQSQGATVNTRLVASCLAFAQEFDTLLAAGAGAGANANRNTLAYACAKAVIGAAATNVALNTNNDPTATATWSTAAAAAVAIYTAGKADLA